MLHVLAKMGNDRRVAMAAVRWNWHAFRRLPQEMRRDRELCTAAVAQDGKALRWVSEEMKDTPEICQAALNNAGQWVDLVFPMVGEDMKNNKDIVLTALKKCVCV